MKPTANYGVGGLFNFHGAFKDKKAAVAKEKEVGGFIRPRLFGPGDYRYMVLTAKKPEQNPMFTRSEKKRVRRKVAHKIKGAARKGFARLFGIELSPGLGGKAAKSSRRSTHRRQLTALGTAASAPVRDDVISALINQGYKRSIAEQMVPSLRPGEGFDSLFRRAVAKNPGELVIFGNPGRVYSRLKVVTEKRKGNPFLIPPGVLEGFQYGLGAEALNELNRLAKQGRLKPVRKPHRRNPSGEDQAADLFEKFHQRPATGVSQLELQRGNKRRKDYTILGPLVAIGVNADATDAKRHALGKKNWETYKVEHWDKLPHLAFMTGSQVNFAKSVLDDPERLYLQNCPWLASSPNGKQLYAITPDPPEIDLRQFHTDTSKDFVDLGEATFVVYIAKKPDTPYEWVHELGEEGGTRPRLMFDRIRKELFFIGGSYRVEAPGILN